MSVTIIQADVTAFAPELATMAIAAWTNTLAYVNTFDLTQVPNLGFMLTQTPEDDATDRLAKIMLAAHVLTMAKRGSSAAAGPLTSESVGGVRRSYGLVQQLLSGSSYMSTRYGQNYLDIVGASVAGPMLV